jgi:hypothetical protein
MFLSADGFEVRPGDTVYIRKEYPELHWEEKIVFTVLSDSKITYDTPDNDGCIGERYNLVYKVKPNA